MKTAWHEQGLRGSGTKRTSGLASASRAILPSVGGLISINEHLLHVRADADG